MLIPLDDEPSDIESARAAHAHNANAMAARKLACSS